MNKIMLIAILMLSAALLFSAPVVTAVSATQRTDGSHYVDITYNLTNATGGQMTIMLIGSNDNGYSFIIPCNLTTGDVGQNIYAGNNKHIAWNAAAEYPNTSCSNFKFKVLAFDGSIPPIPEEFVYVNGGTFTMGNTFGGGSSNELPIHQVTVSSFLIGRYEVTQSEWQEIMGSNPATSYGVGLNYPVYNVSWYATLKYCNLRSMAEGLTPVYSISGSTNPNSWGAMPTSSNATWDAAICNWSANGYRLPTEAEWEYAARGGSTNPDYFYSGSNDINLVAWYSSNSGSVTHPVGLLQFNSLSLYDMSGNVWEWCWDFYGSYSAVGQLNPTGPPSGSTRLLRGGDWSYSSAGCRVSYRVNGVPWYGSDYYGGFRLCRATD
ncbi:MAG: formylglycine-generating enzyme family protein [Candidatus Cloacimonetes bacterium]|nr:formylglycine-generating enzyme family protein [Candidatus Cloacimonadota bacterium]